MPLAALSRLYERLAAEVPDDLPARGYSAQKIAFCVTINADGTLSAVEDARIEEKDPKGKIKLAARICLVPGQGKPSGSGINPCFLWDNAAYMLGFKEDDEKPERTQQSFEKFRAQMCAAEAEINSPDFSCVCRFLERWEPSAFAPTKEQCAYLSGFGVFKIAGQTHFAHESLAIKNWWARRDAAREVGTMGTCLVTGETAPIARLHQPMIKGVLGSQSSGAALVSFNNDAFVSFAKNQGENAPVSEKVVFQYANALNYLLARRAFRIGDATVVFWTESPSASEALLPHMLSGRPSQDEELNNRIQGALEKIKRGTLGRDDLGDAATRFYILGLSPNAARLSVRFWYTGSLGELIENLRKHFDDLNIVREWDENAKHPDSPTPSFYALLSATVRKGDDVPPLLGGLLARAVLTGGDYPFALAAAALRRARIEGHVSYLQAAIIKAFLKRNHQQDIPIMLDSETKSVGYQLGRLFAVLERVQAEAVKDANSTITDRFFSSASATPQSVFPRLVRLAQHHLKKLTDGKNIYYQKLIQEIMGKFETPYYPAHLFAAEQGAFAIGYYQQRKALFTKKDAPESAPSESSESAESTL